MSEPTSVVSRCLSRSFLVQNPPLTAALSIGLFGLGGIVAKSSGKKRVKHSQPKRKLVRRRRRGKRVAVDARFFRRLRALLRIVVPGLMSREAGYLTVEVALLIARSFMSLTIARLEGEAARCTATRDWQGLKETIIVFGLTGLPAAAVNAGLKYVEKLLATCFRERLTKHVHARYLRDNSFYKASNCTGAQRLDNADQRITQDILEFSKTLADLVGHTFKPTLDVILFTKELVDQIGVIGPTAMYSYFLLSSFVTRALSPPFAALTAKKQQLEGDLRHAHSRLIAHAEEVAFLGGGDTEHVLLNGALSRVTSHLRSFVLSQFGKGILDQFVLKYFASVVGVSIFALPIYLGRKMQGFSAAEITGSYVESMRMLMKTATAIGELVLIYKKVQALAGYASRVSELVEQVDGLKAAEKEGWRAVVPADDFHLRPSVLEEGDAIEFDAVSIFAPDGRLLLKELTFSIPLGRNVLIKGPNGAGKTSLFRVMNGMWPLQSGRIVRPAGDGRIFYVPQRPYLVSGSLRDQLVYPDRWEVVGDSVSDEHLLSLLEAVNLSHLVRADPLNNEASADDPGSSTHGLDRWHHDWTDVLSGGEKQRVGLARLYYHSPQYAILDEATSAINVEDEGPLYAKCLELGITVFSIAHRPQVRAYHHYELALAGDGSGSWTFEPIEQE